jgi:hypothetical protein
MSYYVEAPNGQVLPCNWLQYEQLKAMGYVHRILTTNQAVLHKLKYLRKGK